MSDPDQPARPKYDPQYRNYRVATYVVFLGGTIWFFGVMAWAIIDQLF